ncbi:hypothetical protein NV379_02250 [Paenibacillus sp. N1-5-1-14]|uniref:hypothetical protein n=1 Tax=Paenibacillus radicibacter TaxID=2972488 RepID=UPI00215965BE|nr:hypothetical protein [Paenibacillus radicibacter]MCR8641468.1 hypothetical protein [Paenibacillus radicibacter]
MDIKEFYSNEIAFLSNHTIKINFNENSLGVTLTDEDGKQIDFKAFSFLLEQINTLYNKKKEEYYGEDNKGPIDEFTRKRLNLQDYLLYKYEEFGNHKAISEVFHDDNRILTIQEYAVSKETNLRAQDYGFAAHFNIYDLEKILPSILSFYEKNKLEK